MLDIPTLSDRIQRRLQPTQYLPLPLYLLIIIIQPYDFYVGTCARVDCDGVVKPVVSVCDGNYLWLEVDQGLPIYELAGGEGKKDGGTYSESGCETRGISERVAILPNSQYKTSR